MTISSRFVIGAVFVLALQACTSRGHQPGTGPAVPKDVQAERLAALDQAAAQKIYNFGRASLPTGSKIFYVPMRGFKVGSTYYAFRASSVVSFDGSTVTFLNRDGTTNELHDAVEVPDRTSSFVAVKPGQRTPAEFAGRQPDEIKQ